MKKLLLVLGIALMVLNSCSSDSDGSGHSGGLLIKEIISRTVNHDGTEVTSSTKFTYNGNKIFTKTFGIYMNTFYRFTYTGDLITKVTEGDVGFVWMERNYVYDAQDRLIKETSTPVGGVVGLEEDLKIYTYNSDNTILRQSYHSNEVNPADLYETIRISLDASNRFTKVEILDETVWKVRNQITYTNHNSPYSNITGYAKLYPLLDTKNGLNTNTNYTNTSTFAYATNSANFPTQRVEKYRSANGGLFSTTTESYKY